MNHRLIGAMLLFPVFALTGCGHLSQGSSSATFVDSSLGAPTRDARELRIEKSTDIYVDAKPIKPLTLPVYPSKALAAHAGDVTVKMDVTISKDGQVMEVASDMLDFSTLSRFHDDFHAAVKAAVFTWRFEPAQIVRLEPKVNGQPMIVGSEAQERVFVVSFKFTESGVRMATHAAARNK